MVVTIIVKILLALFTLQTLLSIWVICKTFKYRNQSDVPKLFMEYAIVSTLCILGVLTIPIWPLVWLVLWIVLFSSIYRRFKSIG